MFNAAAREAAQSSAWPPLSTYCPSQKIAPFGSMHCTSQPPLRSDSHFTSSNFAWHATWHFAVTFALHLPLHDDLHFTLQSAEGGVPEQDALHLPLQFAWHCALQSPLAVPVPELPLA